MQTRDQPSPSHPTALVTGGSSGIGEAAALALARTGFDVALVARRQQRLELCAKRIEETGRRAIPIVADLSDDAQTGEVVESARRALGRIDLLVNNAGYSPGAAIEQYSRDALRHIFDVNLLSALQLIGAVTPIMRAQGGGRIVNVGSVAGMIPAPLAVPYAATKVGMHAATDALRLELLRFGIRLSLVIPGFVDTDVFENARQGSMHLREDPDNPYRQTMFDLDDLAKKNLKGALAPEDVARVIVKAATARSPRTRYYTPFSAGLQARFMSWLPDRLKDALLQRVYGLTAEPRKARGRGRNVPCSP
jgi:short-subunit dehydrogenase